MTWEVSVLVPSPLSMRTYGDTIRDIQNRLREKGVTVFSAPHLVQRTDMKSAGATIDLFGNASEYNSERCPWQVSIWGERHD